LKNIEENLDKLIFKINYDKVYPMIKKWDFGVDVDTKFYKEHFMLDLYTFYVQDMGETFRFISQDDITDINLLKSRTRENLLNIGNSIVKLDADCTVYTFKNITDLTSSFFLLKDIQNEIIKKVGTRYLFTISSDCTVLISKDYPEYIDMLQALMLRDPGVHKISDKVYRYNNGRYEYADKNSIFTVIK
jgi:uncharacterized protein YtpQ (UPF0354 family)